MGPVMEGAGLNITVLSYMDNVDIGFMACRELVPDVWDLADHVQEAMAELLAAIDAPAPPKPAAKKKTKAAATKEQPAAKKATAKKSAAKQAPKPRKAAAAS